MGKGWRGDDGGGEVVQDGGPVCDVDGCDFEAGGRFVLGWELSSALGLLGVQVA